MITVSLKFNGTDSVTLTTADAKSMNLLRLMFDGRTLWKADIPASVALGEDHQVVLTPTVAKGGE